MWPPLHNYQPDPGSTHPLKNVSEVNAIASDKHTDYNATAHIHMTCMYLHRHNTYVISLKKQMDRQYIFSHV